MDESAGTEGQEQQGGRLLEATAAVQTEIGVLSPLQSEPDKSPSVVQQTELSGPKIPITKPHVTGSLKHMIAATPWLLIS